MTQPGTPAQAGSEVGFMPEALNLFRKAVEGLELGIKALRAGLTTFVNEVDAFLARAEEGLRNGHWWDKLAEWVTSTIADVLAHIRDLLEDVRQKVDQILAMAEKAVVGTTPVLSLFSAGMDWATKVNTPLSEVGPDLSASGKIDFWRTPAYLTFKTRVEDQADAITSVVEKVKATSRWLSDVAEANTSYMVGLAGYASDVGGALATAAADVAQIGAGNAVAAEEAVLDMSDVVGQTVTAIGKYVSGVVGRLAQVMNQVNELVTEYGDHSGLPGGRWPKAVQAS
ncbi:hypothetical protein BJY16_004718 [Actinoplanes octamycinicus]|uniref:Uncharacterized protein n=1 Tax=Actinoplanes octamycinicus TaxID=135948 RepID=A0A7W7M8T9_9ACTN|nr:hypothetical protein [Actinoplanes octamycinicus]MBB4741259.1 hypothetical protein [Actinoplanes octamycinicus]GIE56168.1 hypothetical protein Aoc01nite_15700 [Actinoplanes octamycinicus]